MLALHSAHEHVSVCVCVSAPSARCVAPLHAHFGSSPQVCVLCLFVHAAFPAEDDCVCRQHVRTGVFSISMAAKGPGECCRSTLSVPAAQRSPPPTLFKGLSCWLAELT